MNTKIWIGLLLFFVATFLTACLEDEPYEGPLRDLPAVSIADVSQEEGDDETTFTFTVSLTGLNVTNAGVKYRTVNGTAVEGQDFIGVLEGALLFGPAQTEKTITITILTDFLREEDEIFQVELFDPVNMTIDKGVATAVILNDDTAEGEIFIPDGYTTPESYPGMELVWRDEFGGSVLNEEDWNYEIGTGNNGWGNNELQYYRRENTLIYDGNLVIEARDERFAGSDYTSSRLTTQGKQQFKFGRIDIRAVLPETQGLWPALWMLGANITQVGWPACGEIDIMELRGQQPDRVLGTVHFGGSTAQHQFVGGGFNLPAGEKFSNKFHVFSLIWEEDVIKWLVDDVEFYQFTADDIGNNFYPFNRDFFFIFNIAVGGNFLGSPDETTVFPQRMIVDYIRMFQPE